MLSESGFRAGFEITWTSLSDRKSWRPYPRPPLDTFHVIYHWRYMNSDGDVDPLKLGCGRTKLIVVNQCGAPREQPRAIENPVRARETSDIEDEVVETSDNEELAYDLALQRPSYWLAPSLHPPFLEIAYSNPAASSQQAIGSSSAQPPLVRPVFRIEDHWVHASAEH
jgi:hypothetical protein